MLMISLILDVVEKLMLDELKFVTGNADVVCKSQVGCKWKVVVGRYKFTSSGAGGSSVEYPDLYPTPPLGKQDATSIVCSDTQVQPCVWSGTGKYDSIAVNNHSSLTDAQVEVERER